MLRHTTEQWQATCHQTTSKTKGKGGSGEWCRGGILHGHKWFHRQDDHIKVKSLVQIWQFPPKVVQHSMALTFKTPAWIHGHDSIHNHFHVRYDCQWWGRNVKRVYKTAKKNSLCPCRSDQRLKSVVLPRKSMPHACKNWEGPKNQKRNHLMEASTRSVWRVSFELCRFRLILARTKF